MHVANIPRFILITLIVLAGFYYPSGAQSLKRTVPKANTYNDAIPTGLNSSIIVLKLREGLASVPVHNNRLQSSLPEISILNQRLEIISKNKAARHKSRLNSKIRSI